MGEVLELHAIIKGKVQGVGFRATTCHYAEELGLVGNVRNRTDGTVELYAQGSKESLEKLIDNLKVHDGLGVVDDVISDWGEPSREFESFQIIF